MDTKGNVFVKIKKGMYGLKQAAILVYEKLSERLQAAGYRPIIASTGMWKHKTRQTIFFLYVDDFGVKYFSDSDANHLLQALGKDYQYTVDWSGRNFCGLTFDWNYKDEYVDVSMLEYASDALKKLKYDKKPRHQCSPHGHFPINYGKHDATQYTITPDNKHTLSPTGTKYIQSVTGTFLYYARALNSAMLPALNDIVASKPKQ